MGIGSNIAQDRAVLSDGLMTACHPCDYWNAMGAFGIFHHTLPRIYR